MSDLVPSWTTDLVPYGTPDLPVTSPKQLRKMARRFAGELARQGKPGQLIVWRSTCVRAYLYRGEWVGDCPEEGCKNAEFLTDKPDNFRWKPVRGDRKTIFVCSNEQCGVITRSIQWPAAAEEIEAVLSLRPLALNRNWYPEGHLTAVSHGIPDGQTVADLVAENEAHGVEGIVPRERLTRAIRGR